MIGDCFQHKVRQKELLAYFMKFIYIKVNGYISLSTYMLFIYICELFSNSQEQAAKEAAARAAKEAYEAAFANCSEDVEAARKVAAAAAAAVAKSKKVGSRSYY